jgi:hypothetical protein
MKQVFQAHDGVVFETEFDCVLHEQKLHEQEQNNLRKFQNTYWWNNTRKYELDEEGTWQVYGEDPNCDYHGPHHNPYLATYTGRFLNVAKKAVELVGFWQWGAGGYIKKIEVTKV